MSEQPGVLRVAISGGGLAGVTLLHALRKYSHLDTHIFDAAPAFSTAGAAIGVTRNALQALDLIGPSAAAALERAGAVPQQGVRFLLAETGDAGKVLDEVDSTVAGKRLTSIVQRSTFLNELLKDIPSNHMHASKKLVRIQETNRCITLHFTDDTTHECDILIGADGIHSYIRKHILGDNNPAANPVPTPFWVLLSLHPIDIAQACLGKDLVNHQDAREWSWLGDGVYIMHNVLSEGNQVQFAIAVRSETEPTSATTAEGWRKTVSAKEIETAFKGFPPHLHKAVQELLCKQPEQTGLVLWEHLPAPTYAKGAICIVGDAAHATTPWQASGGGMSIEDALILSSLLGHSASRVEALASLQIFDQLRRPRTQAIVESSRATGIVLTGGDPEMGLHYGKLKGNLVSRWDFIIDFDLGKQQKEALKLLEAERERLLIHP